MSAGTATWRRATLVDRRRESDTGATLTFAVTGWPGHVAGQHADVRLTAEDGYQAERSYSIASAPEDPYLALSIELLEGGEVSSYLVEDMVVGDQLELRGPIGGWFAWRVQDGGPLLLLGGGSGLVPLMSMLRHRARQHASIPARLLVSVRTPGSLFYAAELAQLAAAGDGFELAVTYTRQAPPGWAGRTGRIDHDMLSSIAWAPQQEPRIFACGPTPFVELAADLLVGIGHPAERIRLERFGPTGTEPG